MLSILRRVLFRTIWAFRSKETDDRLSTSGRSGLGLDENTIFDIIYKDISKKMCFKPEDTVLDIGCAEGLLLSRILEDAGAAIAVDTSKRELELAKKNLQNKKVEYVLGPLKEGVLSKATVDKVVCYSVVHYLDSFDVFEDLLQTIYDVLKPGGVAIIGDIPIFDMEEGSRAQAAVGLMKHLYVSYTESNLLKAGEAVGFDVRLLSQASELPFFESRKDLLLIKDR